MVGSFVAHYWPDYMIKIKVAFLEGGLYPAIPSNEKSFQKALIGWKKAGPPKKPLLF